MSILASIRPRLNAPAALGAATWLILVLALSAFLGVLALSFLEPAPTRELVDVSQRLDRARSSTPTENAAALDQAASELHAAQRAIALERNKPWRLRSFDRARALIHKAERILDGSARSPAAPAGPPGS